MAIKRRPIFGRLNRKLFSVANKLHNKNLIYYYQRGGIRL